MSLDLILLACILSNCASDLHNKQAEPSAPISPAVEAEEPTEDEHIEMIRVRFCEYSGGAGGVCGNPIQPKHKSRSASSKRH